MTKHNVPLTKRDGRIILNGETIGRVFKEGAYGWTYEVDRMWVEGGFRRQSDAVIALLGYTRGIKAARRDAAIEATAQLADELGSDEARRASA